MSISYIQTVWAVGPLYVVCGCGCEFSASFKNSHAALANMVLKDQLTLA